MIAAIFLAVMIAVVKVSGWLAGFSLMLYTAHLNLYTGLGSLLVPKWLLIGYLIYACIHYVFALETRTFKEFIVGLCLGGLDTFSKVSFGYLISATLFALGAGITQGDLIGILVLLLFAEVPSFLVKVISSAYKG